MSETLTTYLKNHSLQLTAVALIVTLSLLGIVPAHADLLLPFLLTVDTAGASNSGDSAAGVAAPASATDTASAGTAAPENIPENSSPAQRAAARAATKLSAKGGDKSKATASSSTEQAAGAGSPAAGASTQQGDGDGKPANEDAKTTDGEGKPKGQAAPASTVTAPQDWPEEDRKAFESLPEQGRQTMLNIHKRMHAGFTATMTELAQERSSNRDAIAMGEKFSNDPKGTIAELAKRAGIEVFFDKPSADDNPPEDVLADPKKYAKWIADKAKHDAMKEITEEHQKRDRAARQEQVQKDLQAEFSQAAEKFPDFADHRPAVLKVLNRAPHLSVEEAYRLATFDRVEKVLSDNEKLKRDLAAVTGELETLKKKGTQPPAVDSAGQPSGEDKHLSPAARAVARAERRIAASRNGTVRT